MPTVNNHDVRECLSWGGNAERRLAGSKRSSDGFGGNGFFYPRNIAEEHDYAAPLRFVSGNSYYGYHPFNVNQGDSSDCLMDTSEHSPEALVPSDTSRARKRNVSSDLETHHQPAKRAREDKDASTVAESQGFGSLVPSFGVKTQNYPQNFDLSNHQAPASSSVLMDTVTPRQRCLMGHFI